MKRSLILSLCAVALAAMGMSAAQATVDVALNLHYTNPADPNEGGTWTLVAKSDDPNSTGLTALVTNFLNMPASGVVNGSIGHDINDANGNALVIGTFGSFTEFVYGQDPNDGLVANVGLASGPSNDPFDDLHNAAWDNASVIATGSIADLSTRPSFSTDPNRPNAGNEEISGTITAATIGLTNVRGDSVGVDGLEPGDANRTFGVTGADFAILQVGFDTAPGTWTWDTGDFNSNGTKTGSDFGLLQLNFGAPDPPPPAIAAVPEPATIGLLLAAAACCITLRKRV